MSVINLVSFGGYLLLLIYTFRLLRKSPRKTLENFQLPPNKRLTIGGSLVALAVLFHAAPVFLPGLGLVLSPLSSLPILIGAILLANQALAVFWASACLLFFVNAKEALIFLLATGPLGLTAALTTFVSKPVWKSLAISASLLVCGIHLLIFVLGLPGLQNIIGIMNLVNFSLIVLFGLAYSFLFANIACFLQKCIISLLAKYQLRPKGNDSFNHLQK